MFSYHYRIFDRYDREVVSLAVLGDDQKNWRPQEYGYGRWGCQLRLRFPIAKLLDYEFQLERLEASRNPFAVLVIAHLKTQATTQDLQARLRWKLQLIKRLYELGYSRQDILELFRLLDWMMRLPDNLELEFRDELRRFEEKQQMPYVTSIERIGREEGQREAYREVITNLLKNRFGNQDRNLDEELLQVIEPLTQMPVSEFTSLVLTLSREELLGRFGDK